MSAKKVFDTKVLDDENVDSGFLSGPIHRDQYDSDKEPDKSDEDVDDDKVKSVPVDLDSGLCLSGQLDNLSVDETTPTPTAIPSVRISYQSADIPPLAILFQQDDDGDTQLHIAAVHGCQRSVGLLISVCPARYILDLPNDFGHTALHLAVMSGHEVVTRMLVMAGASIAVRDLNGDTPIHIAVAGKNVKCLQALLMPIDDPRLRTVNVQEALNIDNYDGQMAVHLAANSDHRPTMQMLLAFRADFNAKEGYAGWTPLHIAARKGDVRLAQLLLSAPGVNPQVRDYAGRTPRRLARKMKTFTSDEAKRLLSSVPEDSDEDTDSEDEYDSDSESVELLFDKFQGSLNMASLVN